MFNKLKQMKQMKKEEEKKNAELKANIERLRIMMKETFYPWLKKNSANIEDASILCQVLAGHIHAGFNASAKEVIIEDLELDKFIPNDGDKKKYQEAIAMVQGETVQDALMVFEGMPKAIGACVNKELKGRKLEELKELEDDFKV